MQIGSVILKYNTNKEKYNIMEQLIQQFNNIETNFSIIYIKLNQIKNLLCVPVKFCGFYKWFVTTNKYHKSSEKGVFVIFMYK